MRPNQAALPKEEKERRNLENKGYIIKNSLTYQNVTLIIILILFTDFFNNIIIIFFQLFSYILILLLCHTLCRPEALSEYSFIILVLYFEYSTSRKP